MAKGRRKRSGDRVGDGPGDPPGDRPGDIGGTAPGAARREPTEDEQRRAWGSAGMIRGLHAGLTPTHEIARRVRVPVEAVERVLAAPGAGGDLPTESESSWASSWAEPGERPQGGPIRLEPGSTWDYRPTPVGAEVIQALRDLGARGNLAQFIVKRWEQSQVMDGATLEAICLDAAAPGSVARSARRFVEERSRPSGAASAAAPADALSRAMASQRDALAHRLEMAQAEAAIAELERKARGETADTVRHDDPEKAELRSRIAALSDQIRKDELAAIEQRHTEAMRSLEARLTHRKTAEDVELDALARSESIRYDSQGRLMNTLTTRIDRSPTLQQLAATPRGAKLLGLADRRFEQLVGDGGSAGTGVPPTDAEMTEAAAIMDGESRRAGADRPPLPERPRVTVPRPPADDPEAPSG